MKKQYCAAGDDVGKLCVFCVTFAVGELASGLNGVARHVGASGGPHV